MSRTGRWITSLCVSTALVWALGCGDDDGGAAAASPQIRLAANPWTGSEVDAAVAKILLEEQLGFPTEIEQIDENSQWRKIADGEIHACLEVWPSGHRADIATYIQQHGGVDDGGPLGVVGKIGWFVPSYLANAYPELATWEGLKDPNIVALLRSPSTGTKGQFLAGDPTWVQYDQQIIDNLHLDLEVVFSGSESALLAAVDAAYQMQAPLLFYFWTPHAAHQRYALTQVELPPHTDECYARAATGGVDCDYPADVLMKIFWSGLPQYALRAHQFLANFHYGTEEQTRLIAMVDLDHRTPTEAARTWITQHPEVWQPWIPASSN